MSGEQKMKRVNLTRIHPDDRDEAMARLQQYYPAQHALVTDPISQQVREMFGGEYVDLELPIQEVRPAA